MRKYLYESFHNEFYTNSRCLAVYQLCRNRDWYESDNCLGAFDNAKELWELLKPLADIDDNGGYPLPYIYKFMCYELGVPVKMDFDEKGESILTCDLSQERLLEKIYELFE